MEIGFEKLLSKLSQDELSNWLNEMRPRIDENFKRHSKNCSNWQSALDLFPRGEGRFSVDVRDGVVTIDTHSSISSDSLEPALRKFMPWKKGPWEIDGLSIDTEWDCSIKWDRISPHLSSLEGKRVLDIGSGNGYYGYRMVQDGGADLVLGLDPTLYTVAQFALFHRLLPQSPLWVLPLGIEDLPQKMDYFDTVFSMGVLYHRRSPVDHIRHLKDLVKPGGEVVVETIVIPESYGDTLVPKDRYQSMPNVWFIPSLSTLQTWMERCGFVDIRVVEAVATSPSEQRKTSWIDGESLDRFLSDDGKLTVEGYPAPQRAAVIAKRRS